MEEQVTRAASVIGFTVAYAVASYLKNVKKDNSVEFSPKYFGTTLLVGLITGGLVFQAGDAATPEVVVATSTTAVYIVDQALNMVMDKPPKAKPIRGI